MLNLKKVHHIAIICADYEKTKNFYTKILGFKILNEVYRSERDSYKLDLLLNDLYQLEIFSFPHPPTRVSGPEACGLRHIAFEVDDIDESVKWLKNENILAEPIRVDPITSWRFTFFADPDGLPIELYGK